MKKQTKKNRKGTKPTQGVTRKQEQDRKSFISELGERAVKRLLETTAEKNVKPTDKEIKSPTEPESSAVRSQDGALLLFMLLLFVSTLGSFVVYSSLPAILLFVGMVLIGIGLIIEKILDIFQKFAKKICPEWLARTWFVKTNHWIEKDFTRFEQRLKKHLEIIHLEIFSFSAFIFALPLILVVLSLLNIVLFGTILLDGLLCVVVIIFNFSFLLAMNPLIAWIEYALIADLFLAFQHRLLPAEASPSSVITMLGGGAIGFLMWIWKEIRAKKYGSPYLRI